MKRITRSPSGPAALSFIAPPRATPFSAGRTFVDELQVFTEREAALQPRVHIAQRDALAYANEIEFSDGHRLLRPGQQPEIQPVRRLVGCDVQGGAALSGFYGQGCPADAAADRTACWFMASRTSLSRRANGQTPARQACANVLDLPINHKAVT